MKTLFPHNPHLLQRPLHAAAMLRIQQRDHSLITRRSRALRAVLMLLTSPFRSTRPEPLLVAMCAVYLGSYGVIRLLF